MPLAQPVFLERDSPIPLYFQIAQQMETAIETGVIHPGDTIPSEFELAEQLGVSRPTIRQAVQQLVLKGYVVRRRGIGTVVIHRRIHRPASTSSFFDALAASGRSPRTEVLDQSVAPAPAEVASALQLPATARVLSLHRVRFADEQPIALMSNFIPLDVIGEAPDLAALERGSLYSLLREQGVEFDYARQEIAARVATSRESSALRAKRGTTLLTMKRTAYDTSGRAIEVGDHVYLADLYSFEMTLSIS